MDKFVVEAVQRTRHEYVEAKIALRHAEDELGDAEVAFKAGVDYVGLGKNNDARDIALAELMRTDDTLAKLRERVAQLQDDVDRAEDSYKAACDERRYCENETWARLADYLTGRVDSVDHAQTQAAQQVVVESTGEVLERQVAEYKERYEDDEDDEEDEIPF